MNGHATSGTTHQKDYTPWPVGLIPGIQINMCKSINVMQYIYRKKKYLIISIHAESAFEEVQCPFMTKILNKLRTFMKSNSDYERQNQSQKYWNLSFLLRTALRSRYSLTAFYFNIVLELLASI